VRRRGISLGEVLISLGLMGVMLSMVALLCHDAYVSGRTQEKVGRESQVTLTLLRLAQECKTAQKFVTPRPAQPATQLEFERLDPTRDDRLPAVVPVPPPAGFTSNNPDHYTRVRYRVDAARKLLLRQTNGTGDELERLSGVTRCRGEFLADGRLQIELWVDQDGLEVRRVLTALLPLVALP
jgi:hypothetical protein